MTYDVPKILKPIRHLKQILTNPWSNSSNRIKICHLSVAYQIASQIMSLSLPIT
jgi:hypothetical protein